MGDLCTTRDGSNNTFGGTTALFMDYTIVGGGDSNYADAHNSVILGGVNNFISGGQRDNREYVNKYCIISGGTKNEARHSFNNPFSVITGGSFNQWQCIKKKSMMISGGILNIAFYQNSVITSRQNNQVSGLNLVVLGGWNNRAEGDFTLSVRGNRNKAVGRNSIAMGQKAFVFNDHSMVVSFQGVNNNVLINKDGQLLLHTKKY